MLREPMNIPWVPERIFPSKNNSIVCFHLENLKHKLSHTLVPLEKCYTYFPKHVQEEQAGVSWAGKQ